MRMMHELNMLASGQSYWKARLYTGRTLCELDTITDIRSARTRRTEWLEDLIASGDLGKVREVTLCTPQGEAYLHSERPYAFFQFSQGMVPLFGGEKIKTAQIVGCLEDTNGGCVCAIWDAIEQHLYTDFHTNILNFASWRDSIVPLGRLNIEALGVKL